MWLDFLRKNDGKLIIIRNTYNKHRQSKAMSRGPADNTIYREIQFKHFFLLWMPHRCIRKNWYRNFRSRIVIQISIYRFGHTSLGVERRYGARGVLPFFGNFQAQKFFVHYNTPEIIGVPDAQVLHTQYLKTRSRFSNANLNTWNFWGVIALVFDNTSALKYLIRLYCFEWDDFQPRRLRLP